MEQVLASVRSIYEEYYAALAAARAAAKPTDGMFGFGASIGSDPCQNRFAERLALTLETLASEKPADETAEAVLRYLCEEPARQTGDEVCHWMLLAAHRYGTCLIPYLTAESAASLADFYQTAYPKSGRLPVQNIFYEALCGQGGKTAHKPAFFFAKRKKQ